MKFQREDAALYVLDALDEQDKNEFEIELSQSDELKNWVNDYNFILKQSEPEKPIQTSQEKLQTQRKVLKEKIQISLDREQKHKERTSVVYPIIKNIISARQPVWVAITSIIIAFFIGKGFKTDDATSTYTSVDLSQLIHQNQLSEVNIHLDENKNAPIRLAVHASKEFEYAGDLKNDIILNLLFYLLLNDKNPGKRLKAVKLLEDAQLQETGRNVLISSMLSDNNPGIRLKSARMLQSYNADQLLIDACVKTILEDNNTAVRLSAMDILESNPSPNMIPALQVIRFVEDNPYIRTRAEGLLAEFEYLNSGELISE